MYCKSTGFVFAGLTLIVMLLLICAIVFYFKVKWIENKKLKKEPKRIICGLDTNSNALQNLFLQISDKFTWINFVKIGAAKINSRNSLKTVGVLWLIIQETSLKMILV